MFVVARDAYEDVIAHAEEDAPREACGILAGHRDDRGIRVRTAYRSRNVSETPRLTYELAPEEQLETMESIEAHGQEVVGFYHSHPAGPPRPSTTDAAQANWTDYHYLIVSLGGGAPVVDAWLWNGSRFEVENVAVDPPD